LADAACALVVEGGRTMRGSQDWRRLQQGRRSQPSRGGPHKWWLSSLCPTLPLATVSECNAWRRRWTAPQPGPNVPGKSPGN